MTDRLLALAALAALVLFLGFVVLRVPETDITIVVGAVLLMTAFDFVRELFFRRR